MKKIMYRGLFWLCAGGFLGVVVFLFHVKNPHPVAVQFAPPPSEQENELESYLMRNVTTNDVLPGFTPVIIYRFSPQTGDASVAGSGSMFTGSNGRQIVTSAHVFSVENNGPTNQYAIRRLRPREGHVMEFGIESIQSKDKNIPGYESVGTDVVLCSVGVSPRPVASFYENAREEAEKQMVFDVLPLKEARHITSLVSGEKFPIVCIGKQKPGGLGYFIIIDATRQGESGTGFVGGDGNLYVLKGVADTINMTPEAAVQMGYPTNASYSVVVGPLKSSSVIK